jgi:hypothetical protein
MSFQSERYASGPFEKDLGDLEDEDEEEEKDNSSMLDDSSVENA